MSCLWGSWWCGSELGNKTSLLAKLVGCYAVELSMPFDRDNLGSVRVNGMVCAFP
jgi:hypothetical protein